MLSLDLKPSDLAIILQEKDNHPHALVRRKLLVLHLKNLDISTELISKIVNVSLNTVRSYIKEYNSEGLSSILTVHFNKPVSELDKYKEEIKKSFESQPPSTIAEAKNRIEQLTGIRRSPTQIRIFLKSIGARPLKVGVIPGKAVTEAKKKEQAEFLDKELMPRIEQAKRGERKLLFMDAAHFVHGAFLATVWCFVRFWLPSPCGRKRFNVLGAIDAINQELHVVTNTAYINAESVCKLLRLIAGKLEHIPITIVLDNARYQRCKLVQNLAEQLGIELLFLPSYSPNLNLIERLWKWVKNKCLYGKYYETFDLFKQGIENTLQTVALPDTKEELKTLLNLKFQTFEKTQIMTN